MKKILLIILCFCLVLSSCVVAFAESPEDDPIDNNFDLFDGGWVSINMFPSQGFYNNVYRIYHGMTPIDYSYFGDWAPYILKYSVVEPNVHKLDRIILAVANGTSINNFLKSEALYQSELDRIYEYNPSSSDSNSLANYNQQSLNALRNGDTKSFSDKVNLLNDSKGKYTYYDILGAFLEDNPNFGTTFSFDDLISIAFVDLNTNHPTEFHGQTGYQYGFYVDNFVNTVVNPFLHILAGSSLDPIFNQIYINVRDELYFLLWYPSLNKFLITNTDGDRTIVHTLSGTGSPYALSSWAVGLENVKSWYTDLLNSPSYSTIQSNIYTEGLNNSDVVTLLEQIADGLTVNTSVIDNAKLNDNFLYNNDPDIGTLYYSPTTQTYLYETTNYTYEITNNYSYTHINYYMAGSDVPFSQSNYYYELPDGRSSYSLTADEVFGVNLDFDMVNYIPVDSDPYLNMLYHFNGNVVSDSMFSDQSIHFEPVKEYNRNNYRYINDYNYSVSFNVPSTARYSLVYVCRNVSVYLDDVLISSSPFPNLSNGYYFTTDLTQGTHTLRFYSPSANIYASDYIGLFNKVIEYINVGSKSSFTFSSPSPYTFVNTGLEYFDSALYLGGDISHNFKLSGRSSLFDGDYTFSFRWYQELSTASETHYVKIGPQNLSNKYEMQMRFNGSKVTYFGSYDSGNNLNVSIPAGSWNTFTFVRSGSSHLLFLNGILISTVNVNPPSSVFVSDPSVIFEISADSNVHYIDECIFATIPLYTANHIPRLSPYDNDIVLTLPQNLYRNSIAVYSDILINTYRVGGVRPSLPSKGDVFVNFDGVTFESIQQFDGQGWVNVGGMVYYKEHWYSLENFTFAPISGDFDASNPNNYGGTPSADSNTNKTVWDLLSGIVTLLTDLVNNLTQLLYKITSTVGDVANNIVSGLTSIVNNFLDGIVDIFTNLIDKIGSFFSMFDDSAPDVSDSESIFSLIRGTYAVIPTKFLNLITFCFFVLLVIVIISKL